MLGSSDRNRTTATNRQVYYYSNIAPQNINTFNTGGGAWNNLEEFIDKQVVSDTTYVVIGTHFDEYEGTRARVISYMGRDDVDCPTMFYYAVLRTKAGNSGKSVLECSASELQCAAFVLSHDAPKGTKITSSVMKSLADLEKLTGHTFFANVPAAAQLKTTANAADWGL